MRDGTGYLEEALRIAHLIRQQGDDLRDCQRANKTKVSLDDVERLAESIIGLNAWMMQGGYLPEQWTNRVDFNLRRK